MGNRIKYGEFPCSISCHLPLNPCDALMGGRTNAIKLYSCTSEVPCESDLDKQLQELSPPVHQIRYIDVVS